MPSQNSSILGLPLIQPAQAQKHVTHNEALRLLDVLVQLVVSSRSTSAPPVDPPNGRRHIVPAGASGAWAGQQGMLAVYWENAWVFLTPLAGWQAYVKDEDRHVTYQTGSWHEASALQTLPLLGINASADATNRLTVSAANVLLTHEGGDHRLKINKAAETDTASLLFQSNFSGRAEMGAAGNDDFSLRVSPDGSAWTTALQVDASTGRPALPQGLEVSGAITGSAAVGTVSQVGGASTGALIERGSTATGSYTRWADGTQICHFDGLEISAASGSIVQATWTLPQDMTGPYSLSLTLPYGASNWSDPAQRSNVSALVAETVDASSARAGYYPIAGPVTATISQCAIIAVGRWY
ncbi:MAG: DUF2793 domain-containing protein [Sulfitobacter sp.]